MKLNPFVLVFSLFMVLSSMEVFSQQRQITGQVTVFDSIPVIGANVQLRSNDSLFKTDENGFFQIESSGRDRITVTANGFRRERIRINDDTGELSINLKLKSSPGNIDAVYEYGHVEDRDRLFAASSLSANDEDFSSYISMLDLIEGRFPGIDVYGGRIVIRGVSSVGGNTEPLIVVDGVEVTYQYFTMITPNDVKSINIIKDGATAMYGSRGGNGVVVVKTRGASR